VAARRPGPPRRKITIYGWSTSHHRHGPSSAARAVTRRTPLACFTFLYQRPLGNIALQLKAAPSWPRAPLAPSARDGEGGKAAQNDRARWHARAGDADAGVIAADAGNGCGWVDLAAVLAAMGSGATYATCTDDGWRRRTSGLGTSPAGRSAARPGRTFPAGSRSGPCSRNSPAQDPAACHPQPRHRAHRPSAPDPFPQQVVRSRHWSRSKVAAPLVSLAL